MAKRSKGAPGIYELEPGLYKVVISLGRDNAGRYRQHARTVRGTFADLVAVVTVSDSVRRASLARARTSRAAGYVDPGNRVARPSPNAG